MHLNFFLDSRNRGINERAWVVERIHDDNLCGFFINFQFDSYWWYKYKVGNHKYTHGAPTAINTALHGLNYYSSLSGNTKTIPCRCCFENRTVGESADFFDGQMMIGSAKRPVFELNLLVCDLMFRYRSSVVECTHLTRNLNWFGCIKGLYRWN